MPFNWLLQCISGGAEFIAALETPPTEQNLQMTVVAFSAYQRGDLLVPINKMSFAKGIGFLLIANYAILS